jgi:hypothetical protein
MDSKQRHVVSFMPFEFLHVGMRATSGWLDASYRDLVIPAARHPDTGTWMECRAVMAALGRRVSPSSLSSKRVLRDQGRLIPATSQIIHHKPLATACCRPFAEFQRPPLTNASRGAVQVLGTGALSANRQLPGPNSCNGIGRDIALPNQL